MEKSRPKKGAAKVKHLGRHKAKIQHYYAVTYAKRKLRHLLMNNGVAAARSWAQQRSELGALHKAAAELGVVV